MGGGMDGWVDGPGEQQRDQASMATGITLVQPSDATYREELAWRWVAKRLANT